MSKETVTGKVVRTRHAEAGPQRPAGGSEMTTRHAIFRTHYTDLKHLNGSRVTVGAPLSATEARLWDGVSESGDLLKITLPSGDVMVAYADELTPEDHEGLEG